jgi:hypothetical protein
MTELRPGTSPPPVRIPMRFFAMSAPEGELNFHGNKRGKRTDEQFAY